MQKPIYSPEDEQLLMSRLWSPAIKDDPEAFVLFAFPWNTAGTPLEHHHGPRKWQRDVLREIKQHIQKNKNVTEFDVLVFFSFYGFVKFAHGLLLVGC